jgi:hypothetical protein
VRVTDVLEGRTPELDEVRDVVLRDHGVTLRAKVKQAMYSSLATRYRIEIDEEAIRNQSLGGAAAETAGAER